MMMRKLAKRPASSTGTLSSTAAAKRPAVGVGPLLLDGGCGLELKRRKAEGSNVAYNLQLFSTAALRDTPAAVKDLHRDYIRAGCQVLTTASYAVTRFYLDKIGEGSRVPELGALSVRLAREAVVEERAEQSVLVAASVPPLGESYQEVGLPEAEMRSQYTELLSGLHGADIYLCETLPSVSEALLAVGMCRDTFKGARVWISFNPRRCTGGSGESDNVSNSACLADGSSITAAVDAVVTAGVEAILFNCATPEIVEIAIVEAVTAARAMGRCNLRIGGYANFWEEMNLDGWSIDKQESGSGLGDQKSGGMIVRKDLTPVEYASRASRWLSAGATIVGGCCGIGPDAISEVGRQAGIGNLAHSL